MSLSRDFIFNAEYMRLTVFLLLFLTSFELNSQREDYTWPIGYNFERDTILDIIGGMNVSFNTYPPEVDTINRPITFAGNSTSICDSESGELLFYSNGYYLNNKLNQRVLGGDSLIAYDQYTRTGGIGGPQSTLILPFPGRDSQYVLIHRQREILSDTFPPGVRATSLYYSIIDRRGDGGLGEVIDRDILLLEEHLQNGQYTACRHANGRDWWIVARQYYGKKLFVFLLDPTGIRLDHLDSTEELLFYDWGRAEFSPDGTLFAIASGNYSGSIIRNISIYNFDRCEGSFSLKENFNRTNLLGGGSGISFSPNSQLLYFTINDSMLQYDLREPEIIASEKTVAVFDSFFDPFFTYFLYPIYRPDGKQFVISAQSSRWFHTIHAPDSVGVACRMQQNDFPLPKYNFGTTHNYPHFRLGPIDGSTCDTLGIDNVPVALFRYDGKCKGRWFTDLSYYEPEDWFWDFGDENTSDERLPTHRYDSNGVYEVCLTVTNGHGSHTWCDSVTINCITSSTADQNVEINVQIVPNPNPGLMRIDGLGDKDCKVNVFDPSGKEIQLKRRGDWIKIKPDLDGLYIVQIRMEDEVIVRKVIVSRE